MRIRKTTNVICKDCQKEYLKRADTLVKWNGLCKSCTSIDTGKKLKGTIRVPRKYYAACGKYSMWIKVKDYCKSCLKTRMPKGESHWFDINNCRTLCANCHYYITFGIPMPRSIQAWGHNLLKGGSNL